MKQSELLETIRSSKPSLFKGKMTDKVANGLVRAVLDTIRQQVENTQEGSVRIGGLGTFRVRTVDRNGEKGPDKRRVVNFRSKGAKAGASLKRDK
jgi:nucleoid DNA-binding protein